YMRCIAVNCRGSFTATSEATASIRLQLSALTIGNDFPASDPDGLVHRFDGHDAVARLAGVRRIDDQVGNLRSARGEDFQARVAVRPVVTEVIAVGAEAAYAADGQSADAGVSERFFYRLQSADANDGFDLSHGHRS